MTAILSIDAAWTNTQPSGVALVRRDERQWHCLATAPSYTAFCELANGTPINWTAPAFAGMAPDVHALLEAAEHIAGAPIDLVTIDMPIASVPIHGRREADDVISREFGSRWCSAHTPSVLRPGALGEALSNSLNEAGFPLSTQRGQEQVLNQPRLIEVYPHPALLSLLHRPRRVPYKVSKSNKYWPQTPVLVRINNLLVQFNAIYAALTGVFGDLQLQLPGAANVNTLAFLKRYEDVLDALVCAWVGVEFLAGRTVPLGNATAAIWCPRDVVFGDAQ